MLKSILCLQRASWEVSWLFLLVVHGSAMGRNDKLLFSIRGFMACFRKEDIFGTGQSSYFGVCFG